MKHTLYIIIAFVAAQLTAMAQKDLVLFDTKDYEAVGVYDAWENSPFRDGRLEGNAAIVDNPYTDIDEFLGYAPNTSPKVLAVQRSRYGSNQFGARIDLTEPFALSPTMQYVHVLIHRPVGGRVMLIGLGKHRESEWSSQSKETEQLWVLSSSAVTPDKWADAVFAVQGVSGVDIYSLVVVPECESPHDRTDDFVAYIDQITLSSSSTPVVQYEDYPTNFNKTDTYASRTDRGILSVALQGVQTLNITSSPTTNDPLYRNRTETAFAVKAGQSIKPVFGYTGNWMNGYVYVDCNRDGKFSFNINTNGTPAEGSDLMAYSHAGGKNSKGTTTNGNTLQPPALTLPDIDDGFYRLRFKVDWDCLDPGGNTSEANMITANGGGIADYRLRIYSGDKVQVSVAECQNGQIRAMGGIEMPATTAYHQSLPMLAVPFNGHRLDTLYVTHGDLTGQAVVHSVPQRLTEAYTNQDLTGDLLMLPADIVDGDLLLRATFVIDDTDPTGIDNSEQSTENNAQWSMLNGQSTYDLQGRKINSHSSGPKSGFIIKDRKIIYNQ